MNAEEYYNNQRKPINFNRAESMEWIHSPEFVVEFAESFSKHQNKEIIELYIHDLETKTPESPAINNRINWLKEKVNEIK